MIASASSQQTDSDPASLVVVRPSTLDQSVRETVESIVIAVILAFLFRGFIAEAFVIPTGSMAPTLQGRHMDVVCAECGHQYRTGASIENNDFGPVRSHITHTRCPLCRFTMQLDKQSDINQRSFNGDRILVSKFSYAFREPQRWDVIVFKYPGNAKINYIKRLVGLPGETLQIRHGDLYVQQPGPAANGRSASDFRIARKPPDKILAMLQLVDDSRYQSPQLLAAGWPSRWSSSSDNGWRESEGGSFGGGGFECARRAELNWLRFRHLVPRSNDWQALQQGESLPDRGDYQGRLITDFYAYNDSLTQLDYNGDCWVGDLAIECDVEILNGDGELALELVEGGVHYRCQIAVETGQATLSIGDPQQSFVDAAGESTQRPTAATGIRGPGRHHVRFANIDDQLHLWIDGTWVQFAGPTTFIPPTDVVPRWTPNDPGDLQPVGIGVRDLQVRATSLRVLRDVYYRAVHADGDVDSEYTSGHYRSPDDIEAILSQPAQWEGTDLFASRRAVTFYLGPDQFFPLGDNSPQSKDARLWSSRNFLGEAPTPPPYVQRHLLIGRALAIYWPHGWRIHSERLGIIPNFQRISLIR